MNEINAAERRRVAAQDKAEAEKIRVVKVRRVYSIWSSEGFCQP